MTVTIGFISDEHVHSNWSAHLARTCIEAVDIIDDAAILHVVGTQIPHLRNQLVKLFLDESDADWLWMIDTDHSFHETILHRMVEAAEAHDVKILGAVTPIWARATRQTRWNVWEIADNGRRIEIQDPPADTVIEARTGGGCLLVHRDVLEAMDDGTVSPWFRDSYEDHRYMGEDFWFVDRAHDLGFACHVHTGIKVGHTKPIDLTVDDIPEPTPIVAVIPTIANTDGLRRVVDGLAGNVAEIIVCDNGAEGRHLDHLRAMEGNGEIVWLRCHDQGIHEMWNRGVTNALDAYPNAHVLFCNDDITLGTRVPQRLRRTLESYAPLLAVSPTYDERDRDHDVWLTEDICAGRYDGTGGLAGFCFMVDNGLLRGGYEFPERYRWWFGDNHLVSTIVGMGGKCGIVTACTVEHPPDALSWLDEDHPRRQEVLDDMALWESEQAAAREIGRESAARA